MTCADIETQRLEGRLNSNWLHGTRGAHYEHGDPTMPVQFYPDEPLPPQRIQLGNEYIELSDADAAAHMELLQGKLSRKAKTEV